MGSPSRRQLLGLAGVVTLSACASNVPAAGGSGPAVILLIRHAEKPDGSGKPYGITIDGERSNGSLTVRGWNRAGALVELFAPAAGQPMRSGLDRPSAVYAAAPDGDKSQRPSQTVTPLAARLGVTMNTSY